MVDFEGGPPCLRICKDCPRKSPERYAAIRVSTGKAQIVLSETAIDGVYIPSHGRGAGTFHESSTAIAMDTPETFDLFASCEGPLKGSFLQRIGIMSPDCPALETMLGGSPESGDIVGHYAKKLG